MRPFLVILALLLVVLAVVAAFVAGYTLRGDTRVGSNASAGSLDALVIAELKAHYYKPVNAASLDQAGVVGTLKSLHDPYTIYMSAQQTQALAQSLSGSYSGIGAAFDKRGKALLVTQVFAGSPARAAGIAAGDTIVSGDGVAVDGQMDTAVAARIRGADGTKVTLGVRTGGKGSVRSVTLTRRKIAAPETETKLLHRGGKTIGYIYLPSFATGAGAEVRADVARLRARGAQAFVLDLRYDLGGWITEARDVSSDFLSGGVVVSTHGLHEPTRVYYATGHPRPRCRSSCWSTTGRPAPPRSPPGPCRTITGRRSSARAPTARASPRPTSRYPAAPPCT